MKTKILDQIRGSEQGMLQLLEELVNIDSGADALAGINAVAQRIGAFLEVLGFTVEYLETDGAPVQLLARKAQPGKKQVLFSGHMDTVFNQGTAAVRPFKVENGRAYGPGVLDMKGGLLAEAVMQSLSGCDPDFLVYRSSKPEETLALCRSCRANVLVMEVIRQGTWKLSERLRLCSAVKQLGWVCKTLLLVDENADELLASEVRQAVKDQLVDNFIYASVSPTYLAGVIDTL